MLKLYMSKDALYWGSLIGYETQLKLLLESTMFMWYS